MRCDSNLAETQFEIVLEYFRRDAIGIWLGDILKLSQNFFVKLKLDLKIFFVQRGERRGMWT